MGTSSQTADIVLHQHQHIYEIALTGDWLIDAESKDTGSIVSAIGQLPAGSRLLFSTVELGRWDSVLVTEIITILEVAHQTGVLVDRSSLPEAIQGLLKLVYTAPEGAEIKSPIQAASWIDSIRQTLANVSNDLSALLEFVGLLVMTVYDLLRGNSHFRRVDLWLQIQECGPAALPIVTLISLLVGLILAFVGAVQLSLFGAEIYIANLVSLGMTREMGGLMTAIIMSGRTGAAYAAQLGTMRVNDEIDALKTMNLEPLAFLVIPRMTALILIMPLLCLYADLMGIIGGAMVSITLFDISVTEYVDRTINAVQMKDFVIGFIKCAVFGILIALAGCLRGMQCGRSASAVGDAATSAVVTSIVFIVVADSVMTLICNRLGV